MLPTPILHMKHSIAILTLLLFTTSTATAQLHHTVAFQGQAVVWTNYNPSNDLPVWMGARYIPQLNYKLSSPKKTLFDMEVSVHANGSSGLQPFDSITSEGTIKPYRAWLRYTTTQLELRLGLQKINFGSASMLRPLMWFDQVDPRDPLQLTDGVWGFLGRYYFMNNANIWLWALYGNEGLKTWEIGNTTRRTPELGTRVQWPVAKGEVGLSYHHRKANVSFNQYMLQDQSAHSMFSSLEQNQPIDFSFLCSQPPPLDLERIPENRIGLDGKWDLEIGLWMEASWIGKREKIGVLTNQHFLSLGADYTIGLGNGLHVSIEQILTGYGHEFMQFNETAQFTAASFSYPVSLFDNLNVIIYRDWTGKNQYHFVNWQRKYNRISIFLMAFLNPDIVQLPQQSEATRLFSGKGMQLMIVYNH